MVAFGHYIEHLKTCKPEWASRFLNYGNLKTVIVRIRELSHSSDVEEDSDEETPFVCYSQEDLCIYKAATPVTVDEVHTLFCKAITHEVDKAGLFHSQLLNHFRDTLDTQLSEFWNGGTGGPALLPHPDNPQYWENRRLCESVYQEVSTLKHFSGTHRIAIRKIIKKFNKEVKRCGRSDLNIDGASYIARYNDKAEDPHGGGYSNILLETIECTYAEFHACESIQDARQKLKKSIQHHGHESHSFTDIFSIGFCVGFLLPLAFLVVYMLMRRPDSVGLDTFGALLPLYRAAILINAALWAWGLDLYLFHTLFLNHTYILGLNPETQMQWPAMLTFAAFFSILNCVNLAAHVFYFETTHIHYSMLLLCATLLAFCLPLKSFAGSTRKAFLRTLWRCFMVPFTLVYNLLRDPGRLVTVQFRDFYLADQMISAAILLGDVVYASCFGMTGAWRGRPVAMEQAEYCSDVTAHLKPYVICLPYLWRMSQCVIMLKVTGNRTHLFNLVKYALGTIVLIVGAVATNYQDHHLAYPAWVLITFIAQFYSWCWDFLVDWGWKLLDFGALWRKRAPLGRGVSSRSTTPLLSSPYTGGNGGFKTRRKHLSWSVHLVAIPLDLVMRLMFFAKVDEGMHPFIRDPGLLSLFLGLNEIARRCLWNILRIENEQLHNLESYRSKTDEVPEPLNQIFGEDWVVNSKKEKYSSQEGA